MKIILPKISTHKHKYGASNKNSGDNLKWVYADNALWVEKQVQILSQVMKFNLQP